MLMSQRDHFQRHPGRPDFESSASGSRDIRSAAGNPSFARDSGSSCAPQINIGTAPDDTRTNEAELDALLRLAARVPDHGRLGPWRFIIFKEDARARFGAELARIVQHDVPAADGKRLHLERERLTRAPVVVCVVSNVTYGHKIPAWEQELSAGAVCQNMLIAACAMGYASQWITEWYSANPHVDTVLGLGRNERVAGFIYLGTASVDPAERPRPDWRDRVSHF